MLANLPQLLTLIIDSYPEIIISDIKGNDLASPLNNVHVSATAFIAYLYLIFQIWVPLRGACPVIIIIEQHFHTQALRDSLPTWLSNCLILLSH